MSRSQVPHEPLSSLLSLEFLLIVFLVSLVVLLALLFLCLACKLRRMQKDGGGRGGGGGTRSPLVPSTLSGMQNSEGWRGMERGWRKEHPSSLHTLRYAPQDLEDAEGWRRRGGSGTRSPLVPSTLSGKHKLRQKVRGGGGARNTLVPSTLSGMHPKI